MSNLIVRKARKDYVCDCCGHLIKAGTEYIDNVVLKYGNVVKHERYHDECPDEGAAMVLFRKIVAANGDLIASTPSGDKVHVVGIIWDHGLPYVQFIYWIENRAQVIGMDAIKDWIDEHGERILSKS